MTSNLVPDAFVSLMTEPNPELNQQLHALMSWLFVEPNPIGL